MACTSVFFAHLLIFHDVDAVRCLHEDPSVHELDSVCLPHGEVLLHLLADLIVEEYVDGVFLTVSLHLFSLW